MAKTKNRQVNGPQFIRFFKPIIQILREMGGSSTSAEVTNVAIERLNIQEDEQAVVNQKSGRYRVYNQVHWARLYLVNGGLIDSSRRGVWTLTDKGNSIDVDHDLDPIAFFQEVHKQFSVKGTKIPEVEVTNDRGSLVTEPDDTIPDDTNYLLAVLQSLSPSGFERLCQRLLREHGFENVVVTGRSGDGGIDGVGVLQINKFVSFTVLFQCKRYKGTVTAGQVRDFRGSMEGRADKGIIITTGVFTVDARKEARRDGARPIELVDGDTLVGLFETLELGVVPQTTYTVDEKFFDEFRN